MHHLPRSTTAVAEYCSTPQAGTTEPRRALRIRPSPLFPNLVRQQGRPTAAQLSVGSAQLSSGCDAILRCGGRVRPAYVQWLALLFGLPRLHRPLELARACAVPTPTVSDSARMCVLTRVHECRYACVCACMHACVRQLASAQATMHHASQAGACRVGPCRVMSHCDMLHTIVRRRLLQATLSAAVAQIVAPQTLGSVTLGTVRCAGSGVRCPRQPGAFLTAHHPTRNRTRARSGSTSGHTWPHGRRYGAAQAR
jgi:hypothetical protein